MLVQRGSNHRQSCVIIPASSIAALSLVGSISPHLEANTGCAPAVRLDGSYTSPMLPIMYCKIPIRQDLTVLLASLKLINQHGLELTGTCLPLSPEFWIKGLCHHTQSFKKIGFWCCVFNSH